MILAISSWDILPCSLTWTVSLFLRSFPFEKTWNAHTCVWNPWHTCIIFLVLFKLPLISCLRTAYFNSDYFYCCSRFFSPSYSTTPFSCTWPFPHSHCHTSKAIACYKWNWNLGSELWCLVVNLEYSFQEVQSHKVKVLSFPLGTLMLLLRIHITKLNVPLCKHCTVRLIKNKNNRINLPCK